MGQPVVHFEIIGKDGPALHSFYSALFDWEIDADNPMGYGLVARDDNQAADGTGIGGGIGGAPEDYPGHVTIYVAVPDIEAALAQAERRGGTRRMGPERVPGQPIEIGHFADPEGHVIGVMRVLEG